MSTFALKNGLIITPRNLPQTNIKEFFRLLDDKNFGTTKETEVKKIIRKIENDRDPSSQKSNDSC